MVVFLTPIKGQFTQFRRTIKCFTIKALTYVLYSVMNDFIILISIWTLKSTKEVKINPEKIMISPNNYFHNHF